MPYTERDEMKRIFPKSLPSTPSLYRTTNLNEAAFIISQGIRLAGKELKGSKVVLLFAGDEARNLGLEFYNDGVVKAKSFSEALRSIRDYVFAP